MAVVVVVVVVAAIIVGDSNNSRPKECPWLDNLSSLQGYLFHVK